MKTTCENTHPSEISIQIWKLNYLARYSENRFPLFIAQGVTCDTRDSAGKPASKHDRRQRPATDLSILSESTHAHKHTTRL